MSVSITSPLRMRELVPVCALALAFCASPTLAQQGPGAAGPIVGAWTLVSVVAIGADGSRREPFGPNAQGLLIFDAAGRYSLQVCRPARAKFASGNREAGTPEENHATVLGCNPHWGRYTVSEADRTIVFQIDHAMYPNWEGTQQKRPFTVTGNELKYVNPVSTTGTGTAELVWKRAN